MEEEERLSGDLYRELETADTEKENRKWCFYPSPNTIRVKEQSLLLDLFQAFD